MSKARDLADFQGSASALTTGTLPVDRVPYVGRRNLIINGGFDVWQRGTSFTDSNSYTADRWWNFPQGTVSSYRDADEGMCAKYATNGTGGYYYAFRHRIEYENVRHMEGKTVTLSFKVKASQAFTGRLMAYFVHTNYFIQPYDITTEWTTVTKTFTFPVSGVTPNFDQEMFEFILLEQLPSTATDIYITQVQFELGSVATPFEHRSYGEELALCQRYYEVLNNVYLVSSGWASGNSEYHTGYWRTEKRSTPSVSTAGTWSNSTPTINASDTHGYRLNSTSTFYSARTANIIADAEL